MSFVLGGVLGLIAILLHSLCDFNMHIPANAILAVTLLALVAGHYRFATEGCWHTVRWPLRILVMIILLGGIGYLGRQAWQRTHEVRWLVKAGKRPHYSKAKLTALERAFAIDNKNYETPYQIGEDLRLQSWHGADGYEITTTRAMEWFERAMELNSYDPYAPMRYGMCLHWLRRPAEAQPFFDRALALDPNNYYVRAHMAWHYTQLRDWAKAADWAQKSINLKSDAGNTIGWSYLFIALERLREEAVPK